MSWTDEEIDKLFNESANAQSFKYDDAYFSEIEAALPVNKKGKDFLWMGTALLFIAVLTTGYFVTNSNDNTLNGYTDQLANLELNTENNGNLNSSSEDQQSTKRNTTLNEQSLKENENSKTLMDLAATKSELTNDQKSNVSAAQQKGWVNSMYNSGADQSNVASVNSDDGNAANDANPSAQKSNLAANVSAINENNQNNLNNQNQVLATAEPQEIKSDIPSAKIKGQLDTERMPINGVLATNSAIGLDQNLDYSLMPNALPLLGQLRPKAAFYVELNGGVSQSLIANSNAANSSFGGGLGVESYFGNFNLTTGLNFKLSNFNDLSYSESGKNYGLGSIERAGSVNYEKMYSFEMPISFGYNFGKHNVNIGVRPSFLIGAKFQETSFVDGELTRSDEEIGFTDDLTRFGIKPTIGYAYHMNKWTIGGTIGVQLLKSVDETKMKVVNNSFPIEGQVYLRRTIRLR